MKRTAHLPASVWPRQYTTAPDQALAFILAIPFEFTQAIAAAHRYEELTLKPRAIQMHIPLVGSTWSSTPTDRKRRDTA